MSKIRRLGIGFAALALGAVPALASDWVPIAPDNTLYLELNKGLVIVELRPDVAPGHVARIKKLAKAGFYDGTVFHRVIPGFMAQGGDPTGTGTGGSKEPDLKAEFTFHRAPGLPSLASSLAAEALGVAGSAIVLTEPETAQYSRPDGLLQSWMPHCRGVASMARTSDPNTANSQFFIVFGNNSRFLDRQYTAWGRVVYGMDVVDRIAPGEPPAKPDKIVRARLGSDVPAAERINLEEPAANSQVIKDLFQNAALGGRGVDACAVQIPVRVHKEGQ